MFTPFRIGIAGTPNDLLLKNDGFSTKKTPAISTKHLLVGSGSKASDVLMAVEELERELAQEICFFGRCSSFGELTPKCCK